MNYKIKLKDITTFIFDVDGVLTDGSVTIFQNDLLRTLSAKDGYALQYASKNNFTVLVITGGNSVHVMESLLHLGVTEVRLSSSNKLQVYQELKIKYNFLDSQVLYMGDDIPDIPLLKTVHVSSCPQDASSDVKACVDYVSPIHGGKGCARDVIEQTLRVQSKWLLDNAYYW